MALQHFLMVYDLARGELVSLHEFDDSHEAAAAYTDVERNYRSRSDHENFEIVLVGADSLDTVNVTHSRYFRGRELAPFS